MSLALCGSVLEARFWNKVIRGKKNECWIWCAASTNGYGRMFLGRVEGVASHEYAHRFSWMIHHNNGKAIPRGMQVDHTCCNRSCVNPAHLELVSAAENKVREGARQTHCIHGHRYTAHNTYIDGRGHRRCRACAQDRRAAA